MLPMESMLTSIARRMAEAGGGAIGFIDGKLKKGDRIVSERLSHDSKWQSLLFVLHCVALIFASNGRCYGLKSARNSS